MSRADKVIDYLTEHRFITSMDIIEMYNATSPSKVTSTVREKLRMRNKTLADKWEKNENTGNRYKVYWIAEV